MTITRLYATARAKKHMREKHAVGWADVAEIMSQERLQPRKARSGRHERRYSVVGRTETGRRLRLIFAIEEGNKARVVTAYEVKR